MVRAGGTMTDTATTTTSSTSACPFCAAAAADVVWSSDLVIAVRDLFPVAPGHTLVIPRRHMATYFDATPWEQAELWRAVAEVKKHLDGTHHPDGYNVGFNAGEARQPDIGDEPEVGDAGRGADVDPGLQEFSEMGGNFGRTSHVSFIPLFACTHKSALFRSSGWHPMLLPSFMNASCSSHAQFDGFAVHPRRRWAGAPTASNRTVG